jgi:hypothetical protein
VDEVNPILGRHPSMRAVDTHFASTIVLHSAIAVVLPIRWRRAWQAGTLGLEAICLYRNFFEAHLTVRF